MSDEFDDLDISFGEAELAAIDSYSLPASRGVGPSSAAGPSTWASRPSAMSAAVGRGGVTVVPAPAKVLSGTEAAAARRRAVMAAAAAELSTNGAGGGTGSKGAMTGNLQRTTSLYTPSSGPSTSSTLKRQTTLQLPAVPGPSRTFTGPAPPRVHTQQLGLPPAVPLPGYQSTKSAVQTHLPFRSLSQKKTGKTWDRTAYSATGRRVSEGAAKGKGKGKGKGKKGKGKRVIGFGDGDSGESEEEEEEEGFEQFPVPFINPNAPKPTQKHFALPATAGSYIYPINVPKRDYQFEIVRACFLDNVLVALPTGLGKTFIAGVVLLNFYRWFPDGKLVFLMPTKPLVTQQHQACQATCGIPAAATGTVTGDDPEGWRERVWNEKRVIYATPQSFMIDMAQKKRVDPKDVVLLIIDEAHKASGNHSYVQCVAYLQAHNPYFRIVALTATPGRTTEKVQDVVDALHISRIEIREAEAPEISKYMFKKEIYQHCISLTDELQDISNRWARMMKPMIDLCARQNLLSGHQRDATKLKSFHILNLANKPGLEWPVKSQILFLGKMATAMGYLLEFSLKMFHKQLSEFLNGKPGAKKPPSNALTKNSESKRLFADIEGILNDRKRSKASQHPKLETVKDLLIQHLAKFDVGPDGQSTPTRCMVFCQFRSCVGEIVDVLNEQQPLIRAHKFVGRSHSDEDDKGLTQVEQKRVIDDFTGGKYNVLVATSIGEEGLDIGEVDFIVIYNCPKESIKGLQRIGRAGRKRDGFIHIMSMEGREDGNWETAMSNHREIQAEIIHRRNLELFDDVEPLLPGGSMPDCVEQIQDADPWVPEDKLGGRKRKSRAKAKEPAAKRTRGEPIPEGAMDGFVAASKLTKQGKKATSKGKRVTMSDIDDEELPEVSAMFSTEGSSRGSNVTSSNADKARFSNRHSDEIVKTDKAAKRTARKTKQAQAVAPSSPIMPSSPASPTIPNNKAAAGTAQPNAGGITGPYQPILQPSHAQPGNSSAWILDLDDDEYPLRSSKATAPSMGPPATEESPIVARRRPLRNIVPSSDSNTTPDIRVGRPLAPHQRALINSPLQQAHKAKHTDRIDPRTFLEMEAGVSDPSENEDDDSSGEESESDRKFAGHFMPTQAPKGYNQQRAYLAGLSTQRAKEGPAFADRGAEKAAFLAKARRPVLLSQEPVGDPSSGYAETDDSFVVDDDMPITYDTDAGSDA